jgi:hypothetical protein
MQNEPSVNKKGRKCGIRVREQQPRLSPWTARDPFALAALPVRATLSWILADSFQKNCRSTTATAKMKLK